MVNYRSNGGEIEVALVVEILVEWWWWVCHGRDGGSSHCCI